jgi:hypothetical protein
LGKGQKLEWVFVQGGKGQHQRRLDPNLIQQRRCGKQKSKMFWTAFGFGVRTRLVPMDGDPLSAKGGVTARVYQDILNQHLPPILRFGSIFMQDNAPIHKALIIKEWFRERGFELMD